MKTRNIPIIIMLVAGLVTSIVMYVNEYELSVTLKAILIVFFVFYILGLLVEKVLGKYCFAESAESESEAEEEQEETEENRGDKDGSVIEKN